jgi:ABC-2 type transport system permease protein
MKYKLINIWTIATKDIADAFKNRMVISIILAALVMLVLPKWLGSMISPPANEVLVYQPDSTTALETLQESGSFLGITVKSESELIAAVQGGMTISGLVFPSDFPTSVESGQRQEIQGYITWSNRGQIPALQANFQQAIGDSVEVEFDNNLLYPGPNTFSMLSMSFLTMQIVLFLVGISLVPYLMFEEKQTKTLDALLVSPATEGQLVAAKALVGLFYSLLVAVLLFVFNWNSVVHWELAALFTLLTSLFSVSIGLIIGSFYQRQQDVTGLTTGLLIFIIGGIFVGLVQLSVPLIIETILKWLPSTLLFHLLQNVFYQSFSWGMLLPGLLTVIGVTLVLYSVVVWKLRRSDR